EHHEEPGGHREAHLHRPDGCGQRTGAPVGRGVVGHPQVEGEVRGEQREAAGVHGGGHPGGEDGGEPLGGHRATRPDQPNASSASSSSSASLSALFRTARTVPSSAITTVWGRLIPPNAVI